MRRFLAVAVVLVAVLASPALARKWTSRTGGFSVEAELVDVRDGNAVLKKADGTEVSVPMNKLSLADVRYIREELQSAEKAIGARSEPEAAPAGTMPTAVQPAAEQPTPAQSKRGAVSASALRYAWKPGETYMYRVKVQAQFGDVTEEVIGTVAYTAKAPGTDGIVELTYVGDLRRSRKNDTSYSAPLIHFVARPSPSRYRPHYPSHYRGGYISPPPAPERIKIDHYGRIISVETGERLPYLLGRAAHLPLERLSLLDEKSWTIKSDVAVALYKEDWLPHSTWPVSRQEQLPATEKTIYAIQGSDAQGIHLAKTYEMATAAAVDGKPRVAMSGEGKITFDRQRGVFSSSKMKMRLAVRDGGLAVEVTTLVSYELASEAEMAKIKADEAKRLEEAKKRSEELARPVGPNEVDSILKDLRSGDATKRSDAAMRLTHQPPKEPNRKMAAGLESLLKTDDLRVRDCAARALQHWATQESIPALLKLLGDKSPLVRGCAIQALGRLKATSAIDRLIRLWPDEFYVTAALKQMGPAAEPAVLKQLSSDNDRMRSEACQVLEEIGTKKSIPALEKAQNDSNFLVKHSAKNALKAIARRE